MNFEQTVGQLKDLVEELESWSWRSCLTCIHFQEKPDLCKKYNQLPPARVIVDTCESYKENEGLIKEGLSEITATVYNDDIPF